MNFMNTFWLMCVRRTPQNTLEVFGILNKYSEYLYVFYEEYFLVFRILMKYSRILLSILEPKKFPRNTYFCILENSRILRILFFVFGILFKYSEYFQSIQGVRRTHLSLAITMHVKILF